MQSQAAPIDVEKKRFPIPPVVSLLVLVLRGSMKGNRTPTGIWTETSQTPASLPRPASESCCLGHYYLFIPENFLSQGCATRSSGRGAQRPAENCCGRFSLSRQGFGS